MCSIYTHTVEYMDKKRWHQYILTTQSTAELGMEHVPLHSALTGEVPNHTTSILGKIGMSRHIQKQLLAFLINTIYKMHTSTAPILIPQTQDF